MSVERALLCLFETNGNFCLRPPLANPTRNCEWTFLLCFLCSIRLTWVCVITKQLSVHSDQRHAADRPKPAQSILHFPVEILTNIAVHLVVDRSSQRLRVLKTNQLGNLLRVEARRPNLIEFKDLLCFGLTCKYLHSVCQRIYQKQVVLTLPSTKYILGRKQSEVQRECLGKTLINSCYTRTIQTHDSVARHWSGAQNVNWLFISNQHYYQPKSSAMFSGLISSTARLTRSFSNLKFLCLSRLNNETILLCLERGVGKNLKALSITLSEVEDSEACLRHLDHRIARLNTISHLQALQVNDIEPTWVGLINRIHDLKEISLHITNFNPKMVQIFNRQANARKLEIFGGIRDTPIGPSFFQLIHKIFPQIETFKCGLHFGGKENLHFGEVSQYAAVLGQFACLRQFVFNHHNIAEKIDYCEQTSSTRHVLERFYNYSAPYFQTSRSLREIISIDFSDRKLVSGILAERIDLRQDAKSSWPGNVDERVNPQKKFSTSGLNGSGSKSHVHPTVDMLMPAVLFQDSEKSAVKMSKIPDVRDTIMVSFEHRWIRID